MKAPHFLLAGGVFGLLNVLGQESEVAKSLLSAGRPISTLVWKSDKVDSRGSVSPNGHYISFTDRTTGDLVLYEIATNRERRLVEAKNPQRGLFNAMAGDSAFSRDSSRIAYRWFDSRNKETGMRITEVADGAAPSRFYGDPNIRWILPRDWSPDGKWVAAFVALRDNTFQLALISVEDGSIRPLREGISQEQTRLFFSPNGKHVGYDLPQGKVVQRDVWITATDGSGDTLVVKHRANDVMMGWSHDGSRLLFGSDRAGSTGLWSLLMKDGRPQGAPELIKPLGLAVSLGTTESGALFYAAQPGLRGGDILIGSFDLQTGEISGGRDVSPEQENNTNPKWSPDGKYLAYVSERGPPGTNGVIVIRSIESDRTVRELPLSIRVTINRNGGLAGWEPNGRFLLVMGQEYEGRNGAFRVDVETGKAELLFEHFASPALWPSWAPDGKSIYLFKRVAGGQHAFVRREIPSGTESEIIRRPSLAGIHVSPDGNYIATSIDDEPKNQSAILIIPLHGGEPREFMRVGRGNNGGGVGTANWTGDSRSIIARKSRAKESEGELWQVPIDGGAPRKLDVPLEGHVFSFKISPDGTKVAYRRKEPDLAPTPQIWALENFLPRSGR